MINFQILKLMLKIFLCLFTRTFYLAKNSTLNNLDKKLSILVLISFAFFSAKNILRIIDENKKYEYNPIQYPFYSLNKSSFVYDKKLKELMKHNDNNQNKKILIINKELLKSLDTKK